MMSDEIAELIDQTYEVLKYSQEDFNTIDKFVVSELISLSLRRKRPFYNMFGNKLIWSTDKEIEFNLLNEDKNLLIEKFLSWLDYFYADRDWHYETQLFIIANREGFFDNRVVDPESSLPQGAKLSKALKQFIPDKEDRHSVQNKMSEYVQRAKVKGVFCISVHPLDFLSMSCNASNWRSCQALDGEYRSATLSYMLDRSTVVCYIKSKEDKNIEFFPESVPWNDKKWRMLLHFDKDFHSLLLSGRQYPYEINLNGAFTSCLNSLFQFKTNWISTAGYTYESKLTPYPQNLPLIHRYIERKNFGLIGLSEIASYRGTAYNDISAMTYTPYFAYIDNGGGVPEYSPFKIILGDEVPCLGCGNAAVSMGEDSMFCSSCEEKRLDKKYSFVCSGCGRVKPNEQEHFIQNGDYSVCDRCYDELVANCTRCGEECFEEDLNEDGLCLCCRGED